MAAVLAAAGEVFTDATVIYGHGQPLPGAREPR
jgi:hypothetical protein